jgi:hypothetical protein
MKKIALFLSLFLSFAVANDTNKTELNTTKVNATTLKQTQHKSLNKKELYFKDLKREIKNKFAFDAKASGTATVTFVINPLKGKVATWFVNNKQGNSYFIKDLKTNLNEILKTVIPPYGEIAYSEDEETETSVPPFIELKMTFDIKKKVIDNQNYDILSSKDGKKIYFDYIHYLNTVKNIPKKKIAAVIKGKDSYLKNALRAIYYDYYKKDKSKAAFYYNSVLKEKDKFVKLQKDNGFKILVQDWLIRNSEYKKGYNLIKNLNCRLEPQPYRSLCYYFRGIDEYKLGLDYELDLKNAQNYHDKAKELLDLTSK